MTTTSIGYVGTMAGFRCYGIRSLRKAALAGLIMVRDGARIQRQLRRAQACDLRNQIVGQTAAEPPGTSSSAQEKDHISVPVYHDREGAGKICKDGPMGLCLSCVYRAAECAVPHTLECGFYARQDGKTYVGRRDSLGAHVRVEVAHYQGTSYRHESRPLTDVVRHSPDGFEWGYDGSGSADLALSILTDVAGPELADRWYQAFKREIIAGLPRDGWWLSEADVRAWLGKQGEVA